MGLFRLLFWIAIIVAAIWVWRRYISGPKRAAPQQRQDDAAAPMVRCAHCGVHVPKNQALAQEQNWYCSQAHLQQGSQAGDR